MKIINKSIALNIVEPSYMASLAALLWIALYYLPVGGALFRLALPLPIALLQLRRGTRAAFDGVVVQLLLLIILMGPIRGPLFLFPYGLLSFWLGWSWLKSKNWWISWFSGIIIGTIGFLIRVLALSTLVGENLWLVITRASYSLIEKFCVIINIESLPSLLTVQIVAILLIIFQEIVYVLTIHIIAYAVFPKLKSKIPEPPEVLSGFVELNL
tara:strand:+ start:454 stop:1092 length:639 start_codon:yes stop_codon:yes gene_type:complete